MVKRDIKIANKLGLHARASAKWVEVASRFESTNLVAERKGYRANAKSIMGIMCLAASHGSTLTLYADGPEEEEAIAALEELALGRFGEEE